MPNDIKDKLRVLHGGRYGQPTAPKPAPKPTAPSPPPRLQPPSLFDKAPSLRVPSLFDVVEEG